MLHTGTTSTCPPVSTEFYDAAMINSDTPWEPPAAGTEDEHLIGSLDRPSAGTIEILGIDNYVNVVLPFGSPGREFDVDKFPRGGMTSVYDGLVAALLREADPDRQHLIIAITDTIDTMSTLNMSAVLAHLVRDGELALDWDDEITAGACVTRPEEVAAA